MKEMNSIGAMKGIIGSGVPCGTNRPKNFNPCFQKPTPRTIEKEMTARIPVTVKWLVKVKGCTPTTPSGMRPSRLAKRMNMNRLKT